MSQNSFGSNWEGAPTGLSPQVISDLIGAIYDCVLDPGGWEATLVSINRLLSFCDSAMGIHGLRQGNSFLHVAVGVDDEYRRTYQNYAREMEDLWGGVELMQRHPIDEPILASQCATEEQRRNNRYNREILMPRGIVDAVGIAIAREPGLLAYAAFDRHASAGAIGETEVNTIRLLAPHFRRAAAISNLFDLKAVEAAKFTSTLDALSSAIVLVDETLGILYANPAAEMMLSEGVQLRSARGVLTLPVVSSHAALAGAVAQAARDEAQLGQRGIGIPTVGKAGEHAVIHVMPLRRREMRGGAAQGAVAALFLVRSDSDPALPMNALALLYDLTPAEATIFELVCRGKTQPAIAAELGIAPATVKTHLHHVFEKTGCKRQLDLLRLATRLSLTL